MVKQVKGYFYGTGRRKSSTARVFLKEGSGKITINTKDFENYVNRKTARMIILQPLKAVNKLNEFDINVNVRGGGITGQSGAIRLGIARALVQFDESKGEKSDSKQSFRQLLGREGYLERDARRVERKKVGLHKARKATQYSKR